MQPSGSFLCGLEYRFNRFQIMACQGCSISYGNSAIDSTAVRDKRIMEGPL